MDPSTSAAALKLEIARLTGAINRHKSDDPKPPRAQNLPIAGASKPRSNVYVNPNYKPPSTSTSKSSFLAPATTALRPLTPPVVPPSTVKREVVIGGVAFQSSGRSLVRKDLPQPALRPPAVKPPTSRNINFPTLKPVGRVYKPKSSRGRGRGSCNRGLTCLYQHDPAKIAICWPFLQGTCPNTSETCNLSHDPTPNRTPLCVHFANNGRCTRQNCPFPHVRVGQRQGVCRDFAVLGYCEKGLDCDKQHVRECPDFAEKGICNTKGCKLPHVIRANRNRAPPTTTTTSTTGDATSKTSGAHGGDQQRDDAGSDVSSVPQVSAENAQLGDEYISLTFHESESESDDEEEDGEEEDEGDEDNADGADDEEQLEENPSDFVDSSMM
ncbi:hypothetical protein EUX98_g8431 [Antrodiella citrinella]|uniref:C3H1-type domain-containing protein n=1 Tax=Antrodiella citrinella TaxID=2447956 RepID=A0A4S4M7C1_9APHY|nr:hypothetical protein EUX98_g8431 [Antrodiella citrinella]